MMERALITGATGYIGSRLAAKLAGAGVEVTALVRRGSEASLEVPGVRPLAHPGRTAALADAVAALRADAVFHLAALSVPEHGVDDVAPLVESNVLLTAELLEASSRAGVGCFLNTGSYWQYGESGPNSLYAATKEAACGLTAHYAAWEELPAVSLVLYDVYGPADRRPKLWSVLRDAAREGRSIDMTPGHQRIDLVHVDDVCAAYLHAGREVLAGRLAGDGSRWAVATGEPHTLREIVALYGRLLGTAPAVRWGARDYRKGQIMEPWQGPRLPGWMAQTSLEEGLASVIAADAG